MLKDEINKWNKLVADKERLFRQLSNDKTENEEWGKIKQLTDNILSPPNFLYRYTSLERFATLKEGTIIENLQDSNRLSFLLNKSSSMNDFFDFYPEITTEISDEEYEILKEDPLVKSFFITNDLKINELSKSEFLEKYNLLIIRYIDDLRNTTKLLCFTSNYDNLLMWSHYGNSHKGVCIQFNMKDYPIYQAPPLVAVRYEDFKERLRIYTKDFVLDHLKFMIRINENMYTKEKIWSYEEEWRLILKVSEKQSNEKTFFFLYPEKIKNIILGRRFSKNDLISLKELGLFEKFQFYKLTEQNYKSEPMNIIKIDNDLKERIVERTELEI